NPLHSRGFTHLRRRNFGLESRVIITWHGNVQPHMAHDSGRHTGDRPAVDPVDPARHSYRTTRLDTASTPPPLNYARMRRWGVGLNVPKWRPVRAGTRLAACR